MSKNITLEKLLNTPDLDVDVFVDQIKKRMELVKHWSSCRAMEVCSGFVDYMRAKGEKGYSVRHNDLIYRNDRHLVSIEVESSGTCEEVFIRTSTQPSKILDSILITGNHEEKKKEVCDKILEVLKEKELVEE